MSKKRGISNVNLIKYIERNKNIRDNFCGVYSADKLKNFEKCALAIFRKSTKMKLPFAICNTDPISKGGTHWFSLTALQDGSFFLFDSFGMLGFFNFFIDDDYPIIQKFITDFENIPKGDLMFYRFSFDVNAYIKLEQKIINELSDTCKNVCNLLSAFAIAANKSNIIIHGLESQLQLETTATCGIFQLFFFTKLYNNKDINICTDATCSIETIYKVLDGAFNAGSRIKRLKNETIIQQFAKSKNLGTY